MFIAGPDLICHPLQYNDPVGIIVATPGIIAPMRGITESFGKIESESIKSVFTHPIGVNTVDEVLRINTFMIKIITPLCIRICKVRIDIIPWVISSWIIPVKIHLNQRRLVIRVVQHHVQNNSYTTFMTFVDKHL